MPSFSVEFYESPDGSIPVEKFIDEQDTKTQARIYRFLELLEIKGSELREPYSKLLDDGIFELRVQQGKLAARILYFFVVGRRIILTNGFIKKTRKTPTGEIARAKNYRKAFYENEAKEHDKKI